MALTGTSLHADSRQSQRPCRPGRRPRKNDQAGHSGHAEPVDAGQNPGGHFHRRPARAREKQKENDESAQRWVRKRRTGGGQKEDDLARAALERSMSYQQMAGSFASRSRTRRRRWRISKRLSRQLEQKLAEAEAKSDLLVAQHRRSRALGKANDARLAMGDGSKAAAFDRMERKVMHVEAVSQAKSGWEPTTSRTASRHWRKRIKSTSCWRR